MKSLGRVQIPQSPWWYSDYPYTHHSLLGGPKYILIHITVSLVVLSLSLFTSQSPCVNRLSLYSSQSTWWQRKSIYSSQYPWWASVYHYPHYSLFVGTQIIPLLITVSQVTLRLSLYSSVYLEVFKLSLYTSQSSWWHSEYPNTHQSLLG